MADGDKIDTGVKRKLDELNENDEPASPNKSSSNDVMSTSEEVMSSSSNANVLDDSPSTAAPNPAASSTSTPLVTSVVAADGEITLIAGNVFRVQSAELYFHIQAGASGKFYVKAAGLKIVDSQGTLVFPLPNATLPDGAEVEVKDTLNGATTVTVITKRPEPEATPTPSNNWLTSIFASGTSRSAVTVEADPPLKIISLMDTNIVVNGGRSAVITGNGGRLVYSDPGTLTVTVDGSIQSVQNDGTGKLIIIGKITEGVKITSKGSIEITGAVTGKIEEGTGGGTIVVKDSATGTVMIQLMGVGGNTIIIG